MRDKVVLGVTLSIVLLLTLVVYGLVDQSRGPSTKALSLEDSVRSGRAIFAQYCIQCHGPQGEGCIGPALNRTAWQPLINGVKNPGYDESARDTLIKKTIVRGRASNQPGVQMPAWSTSEGGALNDQAIEDVINFIQYGDWSTTLEDAASASNLGSDIPAYGEYTGAKLDQVKQTLLKNGCLNCHRLGSVGGAIGADLSDVGSRRSADWLRRWIKDPKAMPASQRGPNLWLVGPTPSAPPLPSGGAAATPGVGTPAALAPTATAQAFPMNATYMPTISTLSQQDLDLLVDYLSHARTSTK